MNILLINPPNQNEIRSCNPEIIKEERGHEPPLGLLYLAGYLKKYSDFRINLLDAQAEEISYNQLRQKIESYQPDVIGLTAMTFTLLDVIKTIKIAKQINSKIRIVLGGPHAHIYPQETINLPEVDYLVLSEGEIIFHQLLKNIDNYGKLKDIPGLVFKNQQNKTIINPPANYIENLDQLPFPDRKISPYQKYSSVLAVKNPITTMFTSRGCPFQCAFCDRPNLGKKFRARSAKNVVDEMEECLNLGIKEIFIYDDTFTVNKQRVIDICDEIIKRKLKFNWDIRARVDTINQEMLIKLKQAGCARIHYGVEAGTEKILKILNKGITLAQVEKAFQLTKKIGITTLAYFIIGNPTETKQDIIETIKFAKNLNPDFVQITLLTPFPATKIYQMALEQKIFPYDHWKRFAENPQPDFKTKYWEKNLTFEELNNLLNYAYKQFYLRPGYILKKIIQIRSLGELIRKTKAGLRIITMN